MRSITDSSISEVPSHAASSLKHALDHVPRPSHLPDLPDTPDLSDVADHIVDAVEHVGGAAASAAGAAMGVTRSLLERLGLVSRHRGNRHYLLVGLAVIGVVAAIALVRRRSRSSDADQAETIAGPQRLAAAG
jgi:hypothetical protein